MPAQFHVLPVCDGGEDKNRRHCPGLQEGAEVEPIVSRWYQRGSDGESDLQWRFEIRVRRQAHSQPVAGTHWNHHHHRAALLLCRPGWNDWGHCAGASHSRSRQVEDFVETPPSYRLVFRVLRETSIQPSDEHGAQNGWADQTDERGDPGNASHQNVHLGETLCQTGGNQSMVSFFALNAAHLLNTKSGFSSEHLDQEWKVYAFLHNIWVLSCT